MWYSVREWLVSIHAPAWGATTIPSSTIRAWICFNPRTRVGCDGMTSGSMRPSAWFQSTHPRGVRLRHQSRPSPHGRVSIHAPAWGATVAVHVAQIISQRFNPRTRVGCDNSSPGWCRTPKMFQSTHPRGVRRRAWADTQKDTQVSIHAPAWGATKWA